MIIIACFILFGIFVSFGIFVFSYSFIFPYDLVFSYMSVCLHNIVCFICGYFGLLKLCSVVFSLFRILLWFAFLCFVLFVFLFSWRRIRCFVCFQIWCFCIFFLQTPISQVCIFRFAFLFISVWYLIIFRHFPKSRFLFSDFVFAHWFNDFILDFHIIRFSDFECSRRSDVSNYIFLLFLGVCRAPLDPGWEKRISRLRRFQMHGVSSKSGLWEAGACRLSFGVTARPPRLGSGPPGNTPSPTPPPRQHVWARTERHGKKIIAYWDI